MQWPSKCVRPSNLIMAISCYSDFSNSLLGAATGTGYWLKMWGCLACALGERGWSDCFPESRCNSTPPPTHPTQPASLPVQPPPSSLHATHKHTNTKHAYTGDKCILSHLLGDSTEIIHTRFGHFSTDGKNKQLWENVPELWNKDRRPPPTTLLFPYLDVQLFV